MRPSNCIGHHYSTALAVLLLVGLTIVTGGGYVSCNGASRKPTTPSTIEQAASLNLKSILEHQQALARECQQYEGEKLRQIKQLIRFDRENEQIHLPHPLPIKLPAVCLFLFGPPGAVSVHNTDDNDNGYGNGDRNDANGRGHSSDNNGLKPDLVNWIYDSKELLDDESFGGRPDNMSKRQTVDSATSESLLADYLYDLDESARRHWPADHDEWPRSRHAASPNELDDAANGEPEQMRKFHEDVKRLLSDDRFKQAIELGKEQFGAYLSPVVLVPGLLGSRLQARTAKRQRVNIFCSKQSDWQDMWLSLKMFLPIAVDCWLDNVRLEFDPSTGFARQPPGVEVRVADFGSVESVRHLDMRSPTLTEYYNTIIERYEQLGYSPDRNLFAAPYDFRLAPQQLNATYFGRLRHLIERAQDTNSNNKVTLVCHSMGCTHLLVFLRQQSAAWRQKRLRKLIALSSPWAGTVKALKALVVGDALDLPLVSEPKMRRLARSYPSIAYLLPQADVFGRPNKHNAQPNGGPDLVVTPAKRYKVAQVASLLRELNLTTQLDWFQRTAPLIRPLEPLDDLQVDCIHSLNVPSTETLLFRRQAHFPDGPYELINGDGDGTVNYQSLLVCADWAAMLPNKVRHKIIYNTNHLGVLSHEATLTHITDDVLTSSDH